MPAAPGSSLAIVGSAGNDTINAKHHPAGQPAPGAGADIILGLAGNDVLKGLGGSDTLVGGLGKDTLFGGTGGDSFVFQRPGDVDGRPRDVIMDFNHAPDDKIDLYDIDANASKARQPGLRLHRRRYLCPLSREPSFGGRHAALSPAASCRRTSTPTSRPISRSRCMASGAPRRRLRAVASAAGPPS